MDFPELDYYFVPKEAVALMQKYASSAKEIASRIPDKTLWFVVDEKYGMIPFSKEAAESTGEPGALHMVGDAANSLGQTFGAPALTTTLAGAGLGGLVGYGGGYLLEKLMPDTWERGRLRRVTGILGALAGAAPGAFTLAGNYAGSPDKDNVASYNNSVFTKNKIPADLYKRTPEFKDAVRTGFPFFDPPVDHSPEPKIAHYLDIGGLEEQEQLNPLLQVMTNSGQNQFNADIEPRRWHDIVSSDPLIPPQAQAICSGLPYVTAAAQQSSMISPYDVAKMAVGSGLGGAFGLSLGRLAQATIGLPETGVQYLQNAGLLAGAVKSLMPQLF